MKMRAIRITGPISDDDLKEIVAVIRRADERAPNQTFTITTAGLDMGLEEAKELFELTFPPMEGRERFFEVHPADGSHSSDKTKH